MVFEVPASKASIDQNLFRFKIGKVTYSKPKIEFLSGAEVEALAGLDSRTGLEAVTGMFDLFGTADTKVGAAVRTLTFDQVSALVDAWMAASNADVGESSASES